MNPEITAKLHQYIDGFLQIKDYSIFPIGAVVVKDLNLESIGDALREKNISIFDVEKNHPDIILRPLIGRISQHSGSALLIKKDLPPKIFNQLSNLSNNVINVQLAGEGKPTVINPVPKGGFIIIITNEDFFNAQAWGDIISSICRI